VSPDSGTVTLDRAELRRLRHDLRSPLLVISGFAQLLAADRDLSDEDRRLYAERIQTAAEELKALLDDALG
jgi:signal transduction histidine kinase